MRKIKIAGKLIAAAIAAVIAAGTYQTGAYATEYWYTADEPEPTGNATFDAFIREDDYKDDAPWGYYQKPKIANSGSIGCCSYCADFVKYCYGLNTPTSKDSYKDPYQVRAGDVIHLKSANAGHWVAILRREGNNLYTAEGNWASVVRVGWNYWLEDNDIKGSRHSFDVGYHFTAAPTVTTDGWAYDGLGWMYSYSGGVYAQGEWLKDNGVWYFIGGDGYMMTGWQLLDDKWYYFGTNGKMATGWRKIDGKYYYFRGGAMVKGWKKLKGEWYYFTGGGAMVTGWKKIGGVWYLFTEDGQMLDGWQEVDGKTYYLDDGAMVTGTQVIDGSEYVFNNKGALISTE